jgi:hypothetical protein
MCVRELACVSVCVWAPTLACARVTLLIKHATRLSGYTKFFDIINSKLFGGGKKKCGLQNVYFDFIYDFYLKHFSF